MMKLVEPWGIWFVGGTQVSLSVPKGEPEDVVIPKILYTMKQAGIPREKIGVVKVYAGAQDIYMMFDTRKEGEENGDAADTSVEQ